MVTVFSDGPIAASTRCRKPSAASQPTNEQIFGFVETELTPGTSVEAARVWSDLAALVRAFLSEHVALQDAEYSEVIAF